MNPSTNKNFLFTQIVRRYLFDLALILAGGIVALTLWGQLRFVPVISEASAVTIATATDIRASNFQTIISPLSTGSPPAMAVILALVMNYLDDSIASLRLVMVLLWLLLFYSTYKFAESLKGKLFGLAVAALVVSTGLVASEFVLLSSYLGAAAFATASLWAAKKKQLVLSALSLSMACLFSPLSLVLIPSLTLLKERKLADLKVMILPLLVLGIFYVYHNQVVGWWFAPSDSGIAPTFSLGMFSYSLFVIRKIFVDNSMWLTSLFALISFSIILIKKKFKQLDKQLLQSVSLAIVIFVVLMSIVGSIYGSEYLLILPLVLVGTGYLAFCALKLILPHDRNTAFVALIGILIFYNLFNWRTDPVRSDSFWYRHVPNMSILDMIYITRQSSIYIESFFPDSTIYGSAPESYALTLPSLGYVKKPLSFSWCDQFEPSDQNQQLLLIHSYHPLQPTCQSLIQSQPFELVQTFRSGKRVSQLYLYAKAVEDAEDESI